MTIGGTITSALGLITLSASRHVYLGASALVSGLINGTAVSITTANAGSIFDNSSAGAGTDLTAGTANIQITGYGGSVTMNAASAIGGADAAD